uniref:Uncharacterized protein n=1 Tax=Schistosoma haematobium TaxID=6185 RepID=A0A094ZKH8_SCHHA
MSMHSSFPDTYRKSDDEDHITKSKPLTSKGCSDNNSNNNNLSNSNNDNTDEKKLNDVLKSIEEGDKYSMSVGLVKQVDSDDTIGNHNKVKGMPFD